MKAIMFPLTDFSFPFSFPPLLLLIGFTGHHFKHTAAVCSQSSISGSCAVLGLETYSNLQNSNVCVCVCMVKMNVESKQSQDLQEKVDQLT